MLYGLSSNCTFGGKSGLHKVCSKVSHLILGFGATSAPPPPSAPPPAPPTSPTPAVPSDNGVMLLHQGFEYGVTKHASWMLCVTAVQWWFALKWRKPELSEKVIHAYFISAIAHLATYHDFSKSRMYVEWSKQAEHWHTSIKLLDSDDILSWPLQLL